MKLTKCAAVSKLGKVLAPTCPVKVYQTNDGPILTHRSLIRLAPSLSFKMFSDTVKSFGGLLDELTSSRQPEDATLS